jgi:hypothetical protein
MPTGASAPVTQNEIDVTLKAQDAFLTAVGDLNSIISQVFDSGNTLSTNAMVTTAGAKFGGAVTQWVTDFEDMRSTLQWMADQLGDTAAKLKAGNQQSWEMAAALPSFGGAGDSAYPGGLAPHPAGAPF